MALKLYSGTAGALKVYATDYKKVIKQLNTIDRQHVIQLKKSYREIGADAQKEVKKEVKTMKPVGPMSGMLHGGRTGWGRNYGTTGGPVSGAKRYPYDSVFVEAFNNPKRGQTGIARLRVRSAGTVLADLAKKFSGRAYTRMYKIREFGGEEIMRNHQLSRTGVFYFIRNLGAVSKPSKRKKSRNVYPGFDKAYPAVKIKAEMAIRRALTIISSNIDRISK
jgi:hypothetical protein